MEQIINHVYFSVIAILILFGLRLVSNWFDFQKRSKQIKGFADYMAVLEFHMNKAYEIIHKDRILVYSLEATKMSEKEFEIVTYDFVNLTRKLIGPAVSKDFVSFYGDENTFVLTMVEYFNTRYEEDSIRKQTMDEITSMDENMPEVQTYEPGTGIG